MSWGKFNELKKFSGTPGLQKKRQHKQIGGNQQATKKRKKNTNDTSLSFGGCEEGIAGFSSDEDEYEKTTKEEQLISHRTFAVATKPKRRVPTQHTAHWDSDLLDELVTYDSDDSANNNKPLPAGDQGAVHNIAQQDVLLSQTQAVGGTISEFDSSEEEICETSEEFKISSPTPSPTPRGAETAVGTPRTGSEWLKQVQPLSSTNSQNVTVSPEGKSVIDSAKKKKKFMRSGLAVRLQRLISRERSEKTFWLHKQSDRKDTDRSSIPEEVSSLTIQVLSLLQQCSLHLTRCCVLSDDGSSSLRPPRIVDVVFDAETQRQLRCEAGSVVRIHPPWQRLEVSYSPYPVLLCTYLCEKLPTPPGSPMLIDLSSLPEPSVLNWRHDASRLSLKKSPQKNFHPTKLLFGEDTTSSSHVTERVPTVSRVHENDHSTTILSAIESQGGCSGEYVGFRAVVQRVYRKRVRIAREIIPGSPSQNCLSKSIITQARSAEDKEEIRWALLLQDANKTFCEVQIPANLRVGNGNNWSSCVCDGEGKSFVFSDLKVVQRTNRTRLPGLFSLMDSLWNTGQGTSTEKDHCSQILSPEDSYGSVDRQPRAPPCCCYVMAVQECSRAINCEADQQIGLVNLYKPPVLSTLFGLTQSDIDAPIRVSVWCRVICARARPVDSGQVQSRWTGTQLFATDASLQRVHSGTPQGSQERYCKIDVRASHGVFKSVQNAMKRTGSVFYLKDVACCNNGGQRSIHADAFTVIRKGSPDPSRADTEKGEVDPIPLDIYTELMSLPLRDSISLLSENSGVDSLCWLQGIVLGVDEESACCWLVCPDCGSADLTERSGLPYYCSICQSDVQAPLTRTHLEVLMECDSWREARVRVKLLQSTVENLLPVSYQESEQGYDIECVLGKRLGPLYCYVEHESDLSRTLEEIAMAR